MKILGKIIGKIFVLSFMLLKYTAIFTFFIIDFLLAFFVNNFTTLTKEGRSNIARRERDELRRLRLQKAREDIDSLD